MQKVFWTFLLGLAIALPLRAELTYEGAYNSDINLEEYFDLAYPSPQKSIIYIFYNDVNMSCENCPQTIKLIEQVYDNTYQNEYDLYIIDYGNDQEYNFMETYHLTQPLEVVMVRVDDGATFGYRKLENLNYQISGPLSFADNLKFQINSFLGS